MEGNKPSLSGHGCGQGSHHNPSTTVVAMEGKADLNNLPRPPTDTGNSAGSAQEVRRHRAQQLIKPSSPDTDDDTTMKIVPIKATVVRKHSKQLPSISLLRKKSSDEMVDSSSSSSSSSSPSRGSKLPSKPPPTAAAALCSSLPDDLICKVTSFLDVSSLMQVRKCSRYLRDLVSRNEAGWEHLCKRLWKTKIHVPTVPATVAPKYYMEAYHGSIRDAQRQNLTLEELCYDPEQHTGTIWSFRFKESAGADWTSADPWHCGLPCRKMVFLKDGSVRQYIPAASSTTKSSINNNDDDGDNDNHGSSTAEASSRATSRSSSRSLSEISDSETSLPELISPNFGNMLDTQQSDDNNNNPQPPNNGRLIPPPLSMSWRLLTRPMDLPTRPVGSYVRFSVGGREVPTYSVRRSPTGNWGFVMESCWGVYASFDLPPKQRGGDRRRLRRTDNGARWVEVLENGEETLTTSHHGTGGGGSRSTQQDDSALMDDASLVITNEIQWREAFLYNVGARVLPEGDDATDEFDRAFRGMP